MNEFKVIAVMNEAMLKLLKDKNKNYEKNLEIEKKLEDESLFFKINQLEAYEILENVGVKQEKLNLVYKKLIAPDVFYDLVNKGKIDENNEKLVVKYNKFEYSNLFKKSK